MKRPWLKLLFFLVPALAGALFLWWRFTPEQAVIRRADLIFSTLEKRAISSGSLAEKADRFRETLSPDFQVEAPRPLPSESLPPAVASGLLRNFHENIMSCRISRNEETVAFPTEDQAIYQALIEADVAGGPNNRRLMRYRCRFEFEKSGEEWLLRLVVLTPI